MSAAFIPLERSSSASSSHISLSGGLTQSSGTSTSASCPPSPRQFKLDVIGKSYISVNERFSGCQSIPSYSSNPLETAQASAWLSGNSLEVLQRDEAAAAVSHAQYRFANECKPRGDSTRFIISQGALTLRSEEQQSGYHENCRGTRMTSANTICDMHVMKLEVPFCGEAPMQETKGRTSRYIENLHHDVKPAEIAAFLLSGPLSPTQVPIVNTAEIEPQQRRAVIYTTPPLSSEDGSPAGDSPSETSLSPSTFRVVSRRPSQNPITRPRSMSVWTASTEAPSGRTSRFSNRSLPTAYPSSNTVHGLNAGTGDKPAFSHVHEVPVGTRRFSLSSNLRRPRPSSMISFSSAASSGHLMTPQLGNTTFEEASTSRIVRRTSNSGKTRRTWIPAGNLPSPSEEDERFSFEVGDVTRAATPSDTSPSTSLEPRWRRFMRKIAPSEHRLGTFTRLDSGADTTPRAVHSKSYNGGD